MTNKKAYETGSRNVFKDIGAPNAEEHLVKAQLVFKIDKIMKDRGLKQTEAAVLFGIRQPDVSKLPSQPAPQMPAGLPSSDPGKNKVRHLRSFSRLPARDERAPTESSVGETTKRHPEWV